MNNIFQTLLYQREKQKDTVLATIVWDDGSAPRGAGSQMLVGAEGLLSGTIGGGAVELRSIQLARALLAPADALALDEPFTGLDTENRQRAAACIAQAAERMPVLLVTHDPLDLSTLRARCIKL